MKRILITGAAGVIGRVLRAAYRGKYRLRLSDIAPLGEAAPGVEFVQADITDVAACEKMMQGVECVVHLGGVSVENAWEKILPANIAGCYNVFEAARRSSTAVFSRQWNSTATRARLIERRSIERRSIGRRYRTQDSLRCW